MSADRYDVIVLGVGGMGSAALYHVAKRGVSVVGVERFGVAHDRGSSHGDTRIIRKAYMEAPDYIPLLHRSYELWTELEETSGEKLRHQCGFMTAGAAGSETILGLEACYGAHDVAHERFDGVEAMRRFPQFRLRPEMVVFLDPFGGYLRVEECVRRQAAQAVEAGATLLTEERVTAWEASEDGVVVTTERRQLSAARLIITAGAWAVSELDSLGLNFKIWRKVVFWYGEPDPSHQEDVFPTYYVETDYGHFYGFPAVSELGVKVAEHSFEDLLDHPDQLEQELKPEDEPPNLQFMEEYLPGVEQRRTHYSVCMYTMTPDQHFIVDRHPEYPKVVIGAGFSGHGFKFAPVIGECLAELALDGRSRHPIGFLGANRFLA